MATLFPCGCSDYHECAEILRLRAQLAKCRKQAELTPSGYQIVEQARVLVVEHLAQQTPSEVSMMSAIAMAEAMSPRHDAAPVAPALAPGTIRVHACDCTSRTDCAAKRELDAKLSIELRRIAALTDRQCGAIMREEYRKQAFRKYRHERGESRVVSEAEAMGMLAKQSTLAV